MEFNGRHICARHQAVSLHKPQEALRFFCRRQVIAHHLLFVVFEDHFIM